MANVKSEFNGLEIMFSGKAYMSLDDTLKLSIPNEPPLLMEIQIVKDSKNENRNLEWKVDNGILKITASNLTKPMEHGVLKPWRIGEFENKEWYMTFYFKFIGETILGDFFLFDYILYLGKEVLPNE